MAIEIVDFPMNSMVMFQFAMLNYQRVEHVEIDQTRLAGLVGFYYDAVFIVRSCCEEKSVK